MAGHLELLLPDCKHYLLRLGGKNWKYGEPYDLCCIIVEKIEGKDKIAEIFGLYQPITLTQAREIRQILTSAGFTKAKWIRYKNNREHRAMICSTVE